MTSVNLPKNISALISLGFKKVSKWSVKHELNTKRRVICDMNKENLDVMVKFRQALITNWLGKEFYGGIKSENITNSFGIGFVFNYGSYVVFSFRPQIFIFEWRKKIIFCVGFSIHSISSVGSASAWQTRGRGLEPVLMRYIYSGKFSGAKRTSCYNMRCLVRRFSLTCRTFNPRFSRNRAG